MKQLRNGLSMLALVICAIAMPAHAQDKLRLTIANGIAPPYRLTGGSPISSDRSSSRIRKVAFRANVQVNGTLCSEHKCVEQARLGQIDIGSVSGGNIGSFGQTFDILNLPYIFKDDASAEKLINGWLGKELSARAEKELGLHIIAIIPSYSFRNVGNSKREIKVPDDLKGLKIRVTKSPVEFTLMKTWGATAVPFDWAQLYEGLSTGVVDGYYIPDAYVAAQKFYEVAKYITNTGGAWNAHIIFMDKKRYDKLPDWAKQNINQIGDGIRAQSFKVDAEWMAKQNKILEGKVKVYTPTAQELDRWYSGAPVAWAAVKGTYDPALARRALQEQGQSELDQEARGCKSALMLLWQTRAIEPEDVEASQRMQKALPSACIAIDKQGQLHSLHAGQSAERRDREAAEPLLTAGRFGPEAGPWIFVGRTYGRPQTGAKNCALGTSTSMAQCCSNAANGEAFSSWRHPSNAAASSMRCIDWRSAQRCDSTQRKARGPHRGFERLSRNKWFDGAFERMLCCRTNLMWQ